MLKKLFPLPFLYLLFVGTVNANVTIRTPFESKSGVEISISGQITQADVAPIRAALADAINDKSKRVWVTFRLNSTGGDILAAMEIGRLARAAQAEAWATHKCASACVFILAGSVFRQTGAEIVGIHRPTFSKIEKNTDYKEVRRLMGNMEQEIREFFKTMDIPAELLDAMKAVPPERVKWLNQQELEQFRLVGFDPAYNEILDAAGAVRLNISKTEYTRRSALAIQICDAHYEGLTINQAQEATKQSFSCRERVMLTGR